METALIVLVATVTFYIFAKGLEVLSKIDRDDKKQNQPNPIGFTAKHGDE